MSDPVSLVSTVIMGAFLLGVGGVVAVRGQRRRGGVGAGRELGSRDRASGNGRGTAVAVAALTLAGLAGLGAVFVESGLSVAGDDLGFALGLALGVLLGAYLIWGVYHSVKVRGRSTAAAVATGSWALGLLFVVAVSAKLLIG